MKTTISLLFYAKKHKISPQGQVPIYTRITVDGKRFESSTGIYVDYDKWSLEKGKMKNTTEESRLINNHLETIRMQVHEAQVELLQKKIPITIQSIKNQLLGITGKSRMLVGIFQDHNNKIESLVHQEYAPGTLQRYKTSLKHTVDFMQWKHNITDIDIAEIDHAFIMDYEFYLRSVRKCNNNTTVKYLKNFKKIIRICLANGWLDRDPFVNYKSKVREVEREFLTMEQVYQLQNTQFQNEQHTLVKDIFIFSCFTGLAYIDVKNLTKANISIGIDAKKWIFTNRQKTETASRIPLLPIAEQLIQKYETHPYTVIQNKLLPVFCNQKVNIYLKEIAQICNLPNKLTFHIARHTFATSVTLSNGVPIETVSKMLGHKNIRTTQHYAKILDKKVSDDMQLLLDKLEQQTKTTPHPIQKSK